MGNPESASLLKLYEGILQLKTLDECKAFFDDLCTIKELQDLSQRFEVANLLDAGMNYGDISKATGASTATICRVSRCLNYGRDGYRLLIDRLKEEEKQ